MKTIGKYIVRGLLGRGGMGKVFKIEIPVIGKIAALKYLDPNPFLVSLMGMKKIRDLFISEAVVMAGLKHPAIVDIWDFDEVHGHPYYLFDLYSHNLGTVMGESYHSERPCRRLPVEKALHYAGQILAGLECMHAAGIIHRDIKPFNILLTDQDMVKICDFGLSKMRGEVFSGPPGLKIGTPYYAAPEQEEQPDQADQRADLFSAGVLLYRMVTGFLPARQRQPIQTLRPELDGAWDDFFAAALAADLQKRFQSAGAMIHALDGLKAAWETRKQKVCTLLEEIPTRLPKDAAQVPPCLRKEPIKVAGKKAQEVLQMDNLRQPCKYFQGDFQTISPELVLDRAANLIWQRQGSAYPLTWLKAREFVAELNRFKYQGRADWRLPTIAELMTLLTPVPEMKDLCLPPVFNPSQKWLWSCDRQSFISAWYVSLEMGYIAWNDFSAYYHVKGVCGA